MKKSLFFILFLLLSSSFFFVQASENPGPVQRVGIVFSRGVGNIVGLPFELVTTAMREGEMHPKIWPATYAPRLLTNLIYRATSIADDIFLYPVGAPFMKDISPLTRQLGLPDYPWQVFQ